ncbi:hypothetical protein ACH4UM_18690 [Streptomyces sp. NPDC020801]|uniref:hypothetical protein n=1 Tax=Streptomyces sp. NPDC020801 TaxID=3365093 RepID=UPI0037BCAF8B
MYADYSTATDDGPVQWHGGASLSVQGRSYTYRQVAFAATRGHLPDGRVLTECDVPLCVHLEHLSDEAERDERALENLAAAEGTQAPSEPLVANLEPAPSAIPAVGGCGTPSGAREHEACDEELCDACWTAIAAAVGQLSGTAAAS